MKDILNNKIQQLAQEAQQLSNAKMNLQKQFKEIDIRLTQIAGALVELKKIQQEIGEQDEVSGTNKPEIPTGAKEIKPK